MSPPSTHKRTYLFRALLAFGIVGLLLAPPWVNQGGFIESAWAEQPPFKVHSKFSRGVQKWTGVTWISKQVASKVAKSQVEKHTNSDRLKVTVEPYSALDLMKGKAKRVRFKAKNLVIDDVYTIRDVVVDSNSDTPPWVDLEEGQLNSDVEGTFLVRLTPEDLNRAFQSEPFKQATEHIVW